MSSMVTVALFYIIFIPESSLKEQPQSGTFILKKEKRGKLAHPTMAPKIS